jgi:hypothetical protein
MLLPFVANFGIKDVRLCESDLRNGAVARPQII